MRRRDPIYYRAKLQELIDKAEKDGVKFEFIKDHTYGDCLLFSNISCTLSVSLKQYERKERCRNEE